MKILEKACSLISNSSILRNKSVNKMMGSYLDEIEILNNTTDYTNDILISQLNGTIAKNISTLCEFMKEKPILENLSLNLIKYNLIKYLYPFMFVLGLFGNLFSISVLLKINRSKSKANRNFSSCLIMLAFSDIILILFGCLREYCEEILNWKIRSHSNYICKIFFFICYLFRYLFRILH